MKPFHPTFQAQGIGGYFLVPEDQVLPVTFQLNICSLTSPLPNVIEIATCAMRPEIGPGKRVSLDPFECD
jgi:hypothetical protein